MLQIAESVPSAISTKHGAGYHMWDIELKTFFEMLYVKVSSKHFYVQLLTMTVVD